MKYTTLDRNMSNLQIQEGPPETQFRYYSRPNSFANFFCGPAKPTFDNYNPYDPIICISRLYSLSIKWYTNGTQLYDHTTFPFDAIISNCSFQQFVLDVFTSTYWHVRAYPIYITAQSEYMSR